MKVLHINTYDQYGGAERIAVALCRNMPGSTLLVKEKLGGDQPFTVIELPVSWQGKLVQLADKVLWKLGYRKGLRTGLQLGEAFHGTYTLLKQMDAYKEADIVHLHNLHGQYFDLKALAQIAAEKKVVWTMHDLWPMTGGEAYTFEDVAMPEEEKRKMRLRNYPLNGPILDRRTGWLRMKQQLYGACADNIHFVSVSNWLDQAFRHSAVFLNGMQTSVVYNGIETDRFGIKDARSWSMPRVLFFNTGSPFKGGDYFLQALLQINVPFELVVVGNALPEPLAAYIQVQYHQPLHREDDLCRLFNSVDILVFPSIAETFGLLPAEAMLCGVAVLTSDAGGLKEVIVDGVNGFRFKAADVTDLIVKLKHMLMRLDLCRSVGMRGRAYVLENFSMKRMLQGYRQIYEQVMKVRQQVGS